MHAAGAGEIAVIDRVDDQAERLGEHFGAARMEVISREAEIEDFERERFGGGWGLGFAERFVKRRFRGLQQFEERARADAALNRLA